MLTALLMSRVESVSQLPNESHSWIPVQRTPSACFAATTHEGDKKSSSKDDNGVEKNELEDACYDRRISKSIN